MYVTFKVRELKDPKNTLDEAIEQAISRLNEIPNNFTSGGSDTVYVLKVVKKVQRHLPVIITDVQ